MTSHQFLNNQKVIYFWRRKTGNIKLFLLIFYNTFFLGYAASIQENAPSGTSVIRVTATDKDEGDLGIVSYELNHPAFTIGM